MIEPIDRDRAAGVQPLTGGLEAAGEVRERIVPQLLAAFPKDVHRLETPFELEQVQVRAAAIEPVCRWLLERGFNMLLDLGGADYLPRQPRFEVIYHLLALPQLWRLRLRVKLAGPAPVGELVGPQPEPATLTRWRAEEEALGNATEPGPETPELASVGHVWPNAWPAEREVWDQFGIRFAGHPSLTRILNPDDWEGFPLRRDYSLRGPRALSDDRTIAEQNRFHPIQLDEGDRR